MKATFHLRVFVLFAFFIMQMHVISYSQLVSQGPDNGSIFTEEVAGCLSCPGATWSNWQNAMLPDSVYASCQHGYYPMCFMSTCYYSRALMATGFGFSLPAAAIIKGIKADVLRKASNGNAIYDTLVMLLRGGVRTGGNRALAGSFPVLPGYVSYGDSSDLWDTVWTAAEINSGDFGVYFKPLNKSPNLATSEVDHIQVTVFYEDATGIAGQQSSDLNMVYDERFNSLIIIRPGGKSAGSILLYDTKGTLVMEKQLYDSYITISLYELPDGFYVAKLSWGNKNRTLKILHHKK